MKILCLLLISFSVQAFCQEQKEEWPTKIKPESLENYIPWEEAKEIIFRKAENIEVISQGHNLQVNVIYKDQTYFSTIEPILDNIFTVLENCGNKCKHIHWVTQ